MTIPTLTGGMPDLPEPDIESTQCDATMRYTTLHSYSKTSVRAIQEAAFNAGRAEAVWQPIASAPQNRTLLVGYFNKHGKWRTVKGCYYPAGVLLCEDDSTKCDEEGYAPAGWYEECESQDAIARTDETPTHWQPLPTPPAAISQEPK
jgi:hypothetical protein